MFSRIVGSSKTALFVFASGLSFAGSYAYHPPNIVNNDSNPRTFVSDNQWIDLKISKIEKLSHDSRKFTIALPSENHVTGLVTASALLAKCVTAKGSNIIRPYTPISDNNQKGSFDLVIKHYENGKFSSHIFGLKEKDTVSFKGPLLKWPWIPNSYESIVLLGAGTGITPLFQMIKQITNDPKDKTKIHLLYGNKTPQDILLKKELDELKALHPDKLKISYFVDKSEGSFEGNIGFITRDYLKKNVPGPETNTQFFICGPPPFMEAYSGPKDSPQDQGKLSGILSEFGYKSEQVFKF